MKIKNILSQLPENAVFWLLLLSLAAGSAVSLYGKITERAALEQVCIEHGRTDRPHPSAWYCLIALPFHHPGCGRLPGRRIRRQWPRG